MSSGYLAGIPVQDTSPGRRVDFEARAGHDQYVPSCEHFMLKHHA